MKNCISRRSFLKAAGILGAAGALAACGGSSASTSTAASTAGSTAASAAASSTSIKLWTYPIGGWGNDETVQGLVSSFNAKYPDIKVTVEYLDYTNGDDQVNTAIEGGSAPDLIMEGPERLVANWGAKGVMAPLNDLWTDDAKKDIYESVESACKDTAGNYYEYPLCMTAHCMAVNMTKVKEVGADKYLDTDKHTWSTEGFLNTVDALYKGGYENVAAIYCGGQGGDQGTRALVNNLYSDYYVNEDGTSYLANSENNVKALKLLQDMVNNGSMSANASFAAADELQAFANQTCAVSFCWNYSNYTQYAEQTHFTPFAMAFPSDDGKPELEMAGPYGFGVFNNKDEAKIEAAKKFVQFVCDDQTTGIEAVKTTGFFPVHADWGDVYAGDADAETRAPFALMSDYLGRYYNLTGGWTEQRALWWPMLAEILTTGADVQTAADNFVSQANANIG